MSTLERILARFEAVADHLAKEGLAYGKMSGLKEGDKPNDSSPHARGMAYSAGAYGLSAKAIRKELAKIREEESA